MSPAEELVEAADKLLVFGGSKTRRAALRQALQRLPYAGPERQDINRHWPFTPQALGVLARAAALALEGEDKHIRIAHLEQAVKEAL